MKLQCPHCKTSFQVDETDYAAIVAQVKNAEFEKELARRLKEKEDSHRAEERARALEAERAAETRLAEKDRQQAQLQAEKERIQTQLKAEIDRLQTTISGFDALKKAEIASLEQQFKLSLVEERNALRDDIHAKEQAISELNSQLKSQQLAADNKVLELYERHAAVIKAKDEEIEHYKDLKSRLSTKLLGETLERHCHTMFDRARSQGQFMTAYFEKDNDTSIGGTKGDFIFRDYFDGEEYISIMFEMKNEDEKTATKHRNEDFFAKLDKDRRDKKCEYAVLVSMLEADNELYNEGIVDVSYRYDKMFVVRPQFFMAVITMLSRAARRGAENLVTLRRDLEVARAQSIDVTHFEERRDRFAADFNKLVEAHLKKQDDALTALDKAIEAAEKQAENLRKIKSTFEASRQKLIKANEAVENDFTIKKLVHGNPTMRALFNEARRSLGPKDENC